MRRAFDVTRLETRSRRFAYEVKTNGFGASVLLTRPLTEAEAAERAANKIDMYAEEYRQLPDGYQPEVLIGVDPGKQNVVTAVIAGRVRQATEAGQVTEAAEAPTKAEKAAVYAWRTGCAD